MVVHVGGADAPLGSEGAPAEARRVLVPLLTPSLAEPLLQLAAALAAGDGGQLTILSVVEVVDGRSLTRALPLARSYRAMLAASQSTLAPNVRALVRVAPDVYAGIVDAVREAEADLVLIPWKGFSRRPDRVYGELIDRLLAAPPCDVAVARVKTVSDQPRVLVAVRGGPYAELALRVGAQLTRRERRALTVLYAESEAASTEERLPRGLVRRLLSGPDGARVMSLPGEAARAIVQEAAAHDLVIVGATGRHGVVSPLGPIAECVARDTGCSLLIVKSKAPEAPAETALAAGALSTRVDKWFAENTFFFREFSDLARLVDLKRQRGLTIALAMATLNAADTVHGAIKGASGLLQQEYPLLDEIVVVDRGSTDRTVETARELGAEVRCAADLLPEYRAGGGRGEALWKSLTLLRSDLVVWIDPRGRHHPRVIYGIVGPLLTNPDLALVKGFYRQPEGAVLASNWRGGGPISELVIRPLFNLLVPELSGLIQPLSGEFGGRRAVLDRVPFFSGEAVETGLLLDVYSEVGLAGIAQVDLGERPLQLRTQEEAARAANAIMQAVLQRLGERHHRTLLEHVNRSMKLVRYENDEYLLDIEELPDVELPPVAHIRRRS